MPMEDVFCQEKDVMELTTVEIIPMKPTAVCLHFTVLAIIYAKSCCTMQLNDSMIFDQWNGSSKTYVTTRWACPVGDGSWQQHDAVASVHRGSTARK